MLVTLNKNNRGTKTKVVAEAIRELFNKDSKIPVADSIAVADKR